MSDTRRDQIQACVEREFIGPDPIDQEGFLSEEGEEILYGDPPRVRYIAGILFPKEASDDNADLRAEELQMDSEEVAEQVQITDASGEKEEYADPDQAEELINRSNAYKQSAMSLTCSVSTGSIISVVVTAAYYVTEKKKDSVTDKESIRYIRHPIQWDNENKCIHLPTKQNPIIKYGIPDTKLQFDVTWRYQKGNSNIYTFTLENINSGGHSDVTDSNCYFQVQFRLLSDTPFSPLPGSQRINENDEDYQSNLLLYRNVFNYAIGHGCAADWKEENNQVYEIKTAIFPSWEVKPIIPSALDGIVLSMYEFGPSGSLAGILDTLNCLCNQYEKWIHTQEKKAESFDSKYAKTAERHLKNCNTCLKRMRNGISLLSQNKLVLTAFQYMNLAMLQQQLHYNLPLQTWKEAGQDIELSDPVIELPDPDRKETWFGDLNRYGKWRPFQLAFILMNLQSMTDATSIERKIVDLIWFPTGGGKTEAYLGLSAYTIFMRRLMNKSDDGTAILMRYTLRLLTAQQYERASAMICACDLIRKEHEELFGTARISIGLWVGSDTTPNHMKDAVEAYERLHNGKTDQNPFVMLKCPWCGAQMGPVQRGKFTELPGYKKTIGEHRQKRIQYVCRNSKYGCAFSSLAYPLPLYIVDDEIYEKTPTLLLGTVDKFAMLPFRPQAQKIFGIEKGIKHTSPDLIIQDELHLISGPLGSMVGHYETMIDELCAWPTDNGVIKPKIIASTATISRAKEQCNALYDCGKENVFQFPPSGLDAGDSFFAVEDKSANGRRYIGILAGGSSSDTTTAIRLYSSLLYAAKDMKECTEEERDPYWTNMGYFNSIRELGQAQTWIHADIEQYLDTMYKRRNLHKQFASNEEYRNARRYIARDEELTSRIASDKVTASLANLNIRYPRKKDASGTLTAEPIDICLATNMISVGLDVPRLGLMTVSGQPKTTSEYIQATSRVGRDGKNAPGLVFVLYRPGRPRDRSHYEHFREYHSKLYCSVEPTSVTPFSSPVRDRALHAVMVGMMRLEQGEQFNANPPALPDGNIIQHIQDVIRERVNHIDPEETDATIARMKEFLDEWEAWNPRLWEPRLNPDMSYGDETPLMFAWGRERNAYWGERGKETPTSMRNVDSTCEARVLAGKYIEKEEE